VTHSDHASKSAVHLPVVPCDAVQPPYSYSALHRFAHGPSVVPREDA
jgi:hypothetical protein